MYIKHNVMSVTVTFNPNLESGILSSQLEELKKCCTFCLIVDNNSYNVKDIEKLVTPMNGVRLIRLDSNYGIAKALNIGFDFCLANRKGDWIVTMDQDSLILPNTLENVECEIKNFKDDNRIAAFGLNFRDMHFSKYKYANDLPTPIKVNFLITSGCFLRVSVAQKYKFSEGLFMYNVDTDICHRLILDNFELLLLSKARMEHKGGMRTMNSKGKVSHVNEPQRFFYMGRNSITMLKKYNDIDSVIYPVYLLFENIVSNYKIVSSLVNFIKGIWNGLKLNT